MNTAKSYLIWQKFAERASGKPKEHVKHVLLANHMTKDFRVFALCFTNPRCLSFVGRMCWVESGKSTLILYSKFIIIYNLYTSMHACITYILLNDRKDREERR